MTALQEAAPVAEIWETLRQESNVELGPITLADVGPMSGG
jgi:hypothetical protein